jgi:hypothetical protein
MPKVTIELGHLSWTGRTKREAEAARDDHLSALFGYAGSAVPQLLFVGQYVAVLFRQDELCWAYQIYENGTPWSIHSGSETRREADFACRRHLAQSVFQMGVTAPRVTGLEVIHPEDDRGRREHESWIRWQSAFAVAKGSGLSDEEARAVANAR